MAPPNVKIKHLIRSTSGNSRFPKLDECAHFHYENVELGPIKVVLCDRQTESSKMLTFVSSSPNKENEVVRFCFLVLVVSNSRKWVVRRTYSDFVFLDTQLHRCVYDRKYSLLRELPSNVTQKELEDEFSEERVRGMLTEYLERFSQLAGSLITCGPVLNWLELDNRGNRLIVTDEVAINTPAVAAAYVVMRYTAQAADEVSFDVGDMISVIDMPPPDESTWWRGKRGFEVGFFPSECVEVIGDKVPCGFKLSNASTKPVFRKHGKLIAFFRSFLLSRPSRRKLKQSGILKERVFGCDLAEHLLNTAREIPLVLKCCTEFIEEHGVVDGIYRLSGVSSNIQRLRNAFDEDCATNLGDPSIAQDIHSVASLLKMYFRELPNPLLTYQLYDKFVSAVQSNEDVRLLRIRDVVQQLPPPHYRTLQYLLCHLARVASYGERTGMTPKNIAIVWAPNLLRSREVENGGVGALHVVGVQAVLTEYLIRYCDLIFDEKVPALASIDQEDGVALRTRPKSLAISTPTKLLSLEEARARALSTHLPLTQQKYIDVGGGPDKLPPQYHTVIDLPTGKANCLKLKKSPSGWKSFFSRGWYSGSTRDKVRPSLRSSRKSSTSSLPHTSTQLQERVSIDTAAPYHHKKLRTVKSAESLIQCSKDPSPVSDTEYKPGVSRHSSPEASMDSSYSFDVGSPLSKSPSLQKHTRSSSHESYFDNSMDMITDPPVEEEEEEEEEHSLFYYVNEQMQKMKDGSTSPWYTHFDTTDTLDRRLSTDPLDVSSKASEHFQTQQEDTSDSEKGLRKQKLDVTDDFAQAKVQRLSWMENKPLNLSSSMDLEEPTMQTTDRVADTSAFTRSANKQSGYTVNPMLEDTSFWLPRSDQAVFCKLSGNHEEGYKLDPYAFYDCIIDKRVSTNSSDNEAEACAKTVVERYGNAETVLVEVHATQDSSSEGETDSLKVRHSSLCEHDFHSTLLPLDNVLKDVDSNEVNPSVSNIGGTKSGIEDSSVVLRHSGKESSHAENINVENEDHTEGLDTINELASAEEEMSVPEFFFCEETNVAILLPVLDRDLKKGKALDLPTNESTVEFAPSAAVTEDSADRSESSKSEKSVKSPNKANLSLQLSPNFSEGTSQGESSKYQDFEKEEVHSLAYQLRTPPSPIYPLKASKHQDIHAFQTKIENIPLPKKRQILNIPSPSSPVDEVRKKFELRATHTEKTKESPTTVSKPSLKETPSKLSLKKKQLFETRDTMCPKDSPIDFTKRKSDGLVLSSKSENSSTKRRSEPPFNVIEMSSPTEKDRRSSTKCETLNSSPTHNDNSGELSSTKPKTLQPSLFTQLKVRKLQSLQGSSPTSSKPIDPWSDPILDLQEEYHPMIAYPEYTAIADSPVSDGSPSKPLPSSTQHELSEQGSTDQDSSSDIGATTCVEMSDVSGDVAPDSASSSLLNTTTEISTEKTNAVSKVGEVFEDEATKRERINRIKEERRAQLREKLKTESFRLESEEKDKVQTKFRSLKDGCRLSLDTTPTETKSEKKSSSFENEDSEVFNELEDDISPTLRRNTKSLDRASSKKHDKRCSDSSYVRRTSSSSVNQVSDIPKDQQKHEPQSVTKTSYELPSSTDDSRKSVPPLPPPVESRSCLYRKSGDIRDKVAMFERSKDSQDSCRLGPSGKFSQKQSASPLTSSFVR